MILPRIGYVGTEYVGVVLDAPPKIGYIPFRGTPMHFVRYIPGPTHVCMRPACGTSGTNAP